MLTDQSTPPSSASGPIRVLVAAPYTAIRFGLSAIVAADPGCQVAGEAISIESLAQQIDALTPGAVLLDPGDDVDGWLHDLWPLANRPLFPPVLMLLGTPDRAREALQAGARGLLQRDATAEEIGAALRSVATGLVVLDRRLVEPLIEADPPVPPFPPDGAPVEALTSREREVLELIARGLPNKGIAAELRISEHTVKFHVGSVLAKLGASSRSEALARAARLGLIAL